VPRIILLLSFAFDLAAAQNPLDQAYDQLHNKHYEQAVAAFDQAIAREPNRATIRKDLAYTLLKIGENEAARDQFAEAMRLDPSDLHIAMEYAFLCNETKQQAMARRVFNCIRKTGDATAEQAFQNIDRPLAEGIERWRNALEQSPDNFSAHQELAALAEQREDYELAAEHYEKALRLKPEQRSLLLDLGRVWKALGHHEQSFAVLLAASRGQQARVAEQARELLPPRYPYVYEFESALKLDPKNVDLRRELAYLLLEMGKRDEAERQFQAIHEQEPGDAKTNAQLAALRGPQTFLKPAAARPADSNQAKTMAEKSLKAGYMNDALKYLQIAHEADPNDYKVMLQLGWACNALHMDGEAFRWFAMARQSPDPAIAKEANQAYENLRPAQELLRTTLWAFPLFSSRWKDAFGYAQVKTELKLGRLPFRLYASTRFIGDIKQTVQTTAGPQYLSETSLIFGVGVASVPWHGATGWFEAGEAVKYLGSRKDVGAAIPDYRGGVSYAKGFGHVSAGSRGWFAESNDDAIFVSRFANDLLMYSQNRTGYTPAPLENFGLSTQVFWNYNATTDTQRQYWANFVETGPGLRFKVQPLPKMLFSVNFLRGAYLINEGNPRRPNYFDLRVGIWYAFTR
jgi:tetratricopeptide (TPR) repeat protein